MNRNRKLFLNRGKDSCIPVWAYGLIFFQFQVSENKDLQWNKGQKEQTKVGQNKAKNR